MKDLMKSTFSQIKKRKGLMIGIFFVQVILFLSIFVSGLTFQVLGINEARSIIEPLQNSEISPDNLEAADELAKSFDSISQSYKAMWKYMRYSIYIPFILFIILNGIVWMMTFGLRRKVNIKENVNRWLRFAGINLIVFLPYFLFADWYISSIFTADVDVNNFIRNLWIIGYLSLPLYYIAVSGFGLIDKSWKEMCKIFYQKAIKKIYITLPVAAVLHGLIAGTGYLLFLTLDTEVPNLFYVFSTGTLFFTIILIIRLIWINYILD
ncbi:hypothetical protein HQ489_00630 [Candidatus Woesearchaeota archaeon]|nr:hypothetical protein [Candidatus Woesearchaeota archaeon]